MRSQNQMLISGLAASRNVSYIAYFTLLYVLT